MIFHCAGHVIRIVLHLARLNQVIFRESDLVLQVKILGDAEKAVFAHQTTGFDIVVTHTSLRQNALVTAVVMRVIPVERSMRTVRIFILTVISSGIVVVVTTHVTILALLI